MSNAYNYFSKMYGGSMYGGYGGGFGGMAGYGMGAMGNMYN
jgi:hypothetical protein